MSAQESLFGEPPALDTDLSQWFTPRWIADRMAMLVPTTATVLEPSAGGGALIDALVRLGHNQRRIVACDIDPRWVAVLRDKYPMVERRELDFLASPHISYFDVALMNPPYENALHSSFIAKALEQCREVIALVPSSIEYGAERDRDLWATKARVTFRARLPQRVKFGGDNQAMFDSVVLRIERRTAPRPANETAYVFEQVWLP